MPDPTTPSPPAPLPFDQAVAEEVRAALADVFLRHPELKAVGVAFSWAGSLNDAQILHGVWLGPTGRVNTLEGIFGSVAQTMKLLDQQMTSAYEAQAQMRNHATKAGQEAVTRHEEIQRLDQEIEARRRNLGGGSALP
jgi:hypothetical protein